ncbi:hypothetical protein F4821DRAFT_134398 [Hypoxylon rubiginosum]|uniref:Uncharacterized protein n=1 Tax=Hypoxylon rubiginosum TaxID=110542 RepID=A0ACC0DI15_9PEZI|nr:hypothetical protein F4821DRAFT_134398 [Hypoxylon rubiginosum]
MWITAVVQQRNTTPVHTSWALLGPCLARLGLAWLVSGSSVAPLAPKKNIGPTGKVATKEQMKVLLPSWRPQKPDCCPTSSSPTSSTICCPSTIFPHEDPDEHRKKDPQFPSGDFVLIENVSYLLFSFPFCTTVN